MRHLEQDSHTYKINQEDTWHPCADVFPFDFFTKLVKCDYGYVLAYCDRNLDWISIHTGKVVPGAKEWMRLPYGEYTMLHKGDTK